MLTVYLALAWRAAREGLHNEMEIAVRDLVIVRRVANMYASLSLSRARFHMLTTPQDEA